MDFRHPRGQDDEDLQQQYWAPGQGAVLAAPWSEAMHLDQQPPADISWSYAAGADNWWLPQSAAGQQPAFTQYASFPPPGGNWTGDLFSQGGVDFQGAQFPTTAAGMAAGLGPVAGTSSLLADPELDALLGTPASFAGELEWSHHDGPGRHKTRQRISSPAKAILQKWFDDHIEDPYLEKEDVGALSDATGLTARQVRTFFANARARKLPGPAASHVSPPHFSSTDSGKEGRLGRTASSKSARKQAAAAAAACTSHGRGSHSRASSSGEQLPMERFLSSSPEDEGLSEDIVRHAAAFYAHHHQQQPPPSSAELRGSSAHARHAHAQHGRSAPDAQSEAASSNSSNSSHASIDSAANRMPRRGRKRHRGSLRRSNTVVRERTDPGKMYQCTFCNRDFAQKYDWRRHEESVHIPQREWICMPDGPVHGGSSTGVHFCVFCDAASPSLAHLQGHNYAACMTAPQPSRTFTRKDKLIQHLAQVHKQGSMSATMSTTWCRRVERCVAIACGICGVRLPSWNERVEHIAAHFAEGVDMRYWLGTPGGVAALTTPPGEAQSSSATPPAPSSTAAGTSSSASLPSIDPLFPAFTPSSSSSQQCDTNHPCALCPARFPRYADTVFHERQAHRVYKARPQPTDDGGNIRAPPLQQQQQQQQSNIGTGFGTFHQQLQLQGQQRPPFRQADAGGAAVWAGRRVWGDGGGRT